MLAAVMLLPFASRAQVTTFPYSCDFEDATEAAAWTFVNGTLTNQWVLGTAANNTTSGSYGIYISNDAGTSAAYTVNSATTVYAYREFYLTPGEYTVTFDWKCYGESTYDYLLAALVDASVTLTASSSLPTGVSYTAMTASGWRNLGPTSPNLKMNLSSTWNTQTATFTVTTAGTYRIVFLWRNDTSSGTAPGACVDNVVVTQNSCPTPSGLLANNITSSSMDLTWTEIGAATSWLVYVNGEYDGTANSTSYSLTGLNANTNYTVAVRSFCGAGDTSNAISGAFRTACAATQALPFAENFSGYTGLPNYPYNGPAVAPYCWDYYSNGTNTAATTSSSYYGTVATYTSTSSYACLVANDPYLAIPIQLTGANVTSSTYIGYGTARGNTKYAVLPAFAESLSSLQISFDYKMNATYTAAGAASVLDLGYITNDDTATFVSIWNHNSTTTLQHVTELNLSTLAAAAPAGARLAFKFSGVHNGTGTGSGTGSSSGYTTVWAGIDNILVEALPSCFRVTNLTVAATTSSSITLNWVNENTGASFSVYNMADASLVASNIADTFYTVTGLTANTAYTFGVVANCSATDNSDTTSVSGRTDCAPEELPFTEDFSATLANDQCWRGASNATAAQVFAGTALTLTTPSSWTYASAARDGLEAGHYYRNVYGSSVKSWMITPAIDLTTAASAQLSFDVALTDYSNAALPDANGDTNTSQAFMVIVSTDGGNTWLESNATKWQNVGGNFTYASLADTNYQHKVISLNQYLGNTIKIAFYCQSLWSGGDNDLHLDNIAVTEMPACPAPIGLAATGVTAHEATLTWNSTGSSSYTIIDMSDSSFVATANDTTYTITGLTAETTYTYGVASDCSDTSIVTFRTLISCPVPTGLAVTLTPGDGTVADINWVEAGEATEWEICLNNDLANTIVVYDTFYNFTTLTPEQADTVKVRAICGAGDTSAWTAPIIFTPTDSYTLTVNEGTTTNSYVPIYGTWVDDITKSQFIIPAASLTSIQYGRFTKLTFYASNASVNWGVASFNVYLTETTDTAVTALADYTTMTQVYAGSLSISNNKMEVTFTTPYTYMGGNLKVGFLQTVEGTYSGSTWYGVTATGASMGGYGSSVSQRNFLPKMTIAYVPGTAPACLPVTGLTAVNVTADSATLTWNSTGSSSYTIIDMSDSSYVASVTDTFYVLTGLTAMTSYTYGVAANCSSDDSDTIPVSFATACSAVTLPYTEGFEATSATSGCWQLVSNNTANEASMGFTTVDGRSVLQFSSYSSATDYNQYGFSPIMNVSTDAINLGVKVTYATRSSDYLYFGYVTANDTVWDPTAYNTNSGYSSYNWQTLEFVIPATATQLAVRYYGDYQYYAWVDSVSVVEMSASFCYPVTAVTVDSVTATSVSISWTDTSATGNYSVYNGTTYMGTTANTNYTFTGLTATTDYTFGVVALCSATDSSTMVTVGARTDCLGGSCNITINGVDAFGDGWNGASITISQNAETVGTFTLSSGSSFSQTFQVCSGAPVTFTWNSGNYDDEASFQILDGGNNVAYTCTDGSDLTDGAVFTTVANACPSCIAPVLTVDSADLTSVSISWTGNAASYSVYLDSVFVANVTTNTYTFTGLTAATAYTFGVQAFCSATDSSSIATIAANTACNTFAIPFVENFEPEGNEVCWTIHATSTGTTFTTGSGNYVVNGTGLFAFFYSENPPQYLISPELTGTGNGVEMSFSYRVYSATYPESFMVGYSTTTNDTSAFVWSTEQTNLANTTYDRYVENLTAAGIKYVAIKYTANDMYALLIDSLVVRDIPTCDPVTALTASNVTNNSVTLNWTGTAASYDVYNGTTMVANVTTNTYTFTGLTAATAYTFGVQALCSATDSADMVTVAVSTACDDITTLPYNEGFEDGLGCWTSVNGSADGVDWNAQPAFSSGSITPHTGNYMAASWSWNSSAMHADAWLISPKFVLPTVNAGDSLTFSWWARTNHSYPDSYSVVLSNTTNDTAAFTNVIRPYAMADTNDTWVLHTVDLSAYAGQSVYIAFHHVDYDNNYLLIDDIALSQGGYVPPAPDTMTVTFAVNDATMGTTNPAPGTYQYLSGDTVSFEAIATTGHVFTGWQVTVGSQSFTAANLSVYFEVNSFLRYGNVVNVTANFEVGTPDSTTITYAVNDATLGTTNPAPGTYTIYVGDSITASATAYTGSVLAAWVMDIIVDSAVYSSDTLYSDDPEFTNPWYVGRLPQNFVDAGASIVITAIFEDEDPGTTYYTITGVANDPDMGYVLGSNRYAAGSEVVLTAVANNGYRFVRWSNGETTATITFTATENVELTAFFEVDNTGIEDANMANVSIYSTDNKIVVRGAEGQSIYVFDLNGRVMASENNAAESVEFRMQTTGVYLVKVGTAAAKRVVLMR